MPELAIICQPLTYVRRVGKLLIGALRGSKELITKVTGRAKLRWPKMTAGSKVNCLPCFFVERSVIDSLGAEVVLKLEGKD